MHAEPVFGDDSSSVVIGPTGRRDAVVYANHVALAGYLRAWSVRMIPAGHPDPRDEDDYLLGYARALSDLAAHLLDGDGLPGGPIDLTTIPEAHAAH